MKTIKTYALDIKEKYLDDEKSGKLRGNLYALTRGNIRNVCINLVDEELSAKDDKIMRHFFKLKNEDNLRRKINAYDIEGFRPIYNFLKGGNKSIQSFDALELIAVMVDFSPRPYNKYWLETNNLKRIDDPAPQETNTDYNVTYPSHSNNNKPVITLKPKNKNLFLWYSNATASISDKLSWNRMTVAAITIGILAAIITVNNKPLWKLNHYSTTNFDPEKLSNDIIKAYKQEQVNSIKKISVDCNTTFFNINNNPEIWYGKNTKAKLEFFTTLGNHPETGKPLTPITPSIIRTYICKSYK